MGYARAVRMREAVMAGAVGALVSVAAGSSAPTVPDWARYARIAGNGLEREDIGRIIRQAVDGNACGIEADNDLTGRYDSFLAPGEKLADMKAMAVAAHKAGQKVFVYTAGTECITGDAAKAEHTMAKDHPEWLQRDRAGRAAVFGGGTAFWIREGDEDAWVTPLAPEWRRAYMDCIRRMAETGIDGIYVDIPYWMTHFDGWEDTWASFDDFTVAEFRKRTGLDAMKDVKLGEWTDGGFRKWVEFRVKVLTEFMDEINRTVKAVNPACQTIAEIYPGYGEDALRVGADIWSLYPVVDVIAHEYEPGHSVAAEKTPVDWLRLMTGMHMFRSFAAGKPSWMLAYSWDGQGEVKAPECMLTLACAEVMAGCNDWDPEGHGMAGTNDADTRREIFGWIGKYEKMLYGERVPLTPVGVWFSPEARLAAPEELTQGLDGLLWLCMQSHLEFQVVTPRNLDSFAGRAILVPARREWDPEGWKRLDGAGVRGVKVLEMGGEAREYARKVDETFDREAGDGRADEGTGALRKALAARAREAAGQPAVEIEAPPFVLSSVAAVEGRPTVFLANYAGIMAGKRQKSRGIEGIRLGFPEAWGSKVTVLPFMGKPAVLSTRRKDGRRWCVLPRLERGMIVWCAR